ncbi:hypothetical protein JCM11251_006220 [Rhodosporidiobolus azoricus]
MSWRASPSRPAPPVTSGAPKPSTSSSSSYDSFLSSSSSSSSSSAVHAAPPHRTLSSSNSAYNLLSRKMAEIEEADAANDPESDKMSVRSTASRFSTLQGGGSSGGTTVRESAGGRSRAVSGASSVRSGRTVRGWKDEDGDGDVKMSDATEGIQAKGKGKEEQEEGAESPRLVAKRARLRSPPPSSSSPHHSASLPPLSSSSRPTAARDTSDTASVRSRRSTPRLLSLPSSSTLSTSSTTLSTTTAEDLMPQATMMRSPSSGARMSRAPSIASTRSGRGGGEGGGRGGGGGTGRKSSLGARPALEAAKSGSDRTLKSSQPDPTPTPTTTTSAALPQPSSSPAASKSTSLSGSPVESAAPHPRATSTASNLSNRRSWFGRPSPALPPPEPLAENDSSSMTAPVALAASPLVEDPPPPPVNPSPPVPPAAYEDTPQARGWLSLLSRSKPSQVDLASVADGRGEDGRKEVDDQSDREAGVGEVINVEGGETPSATPRATINDDTLRGVPASSDKPFHATENLDSSATQTIDRQTALPPSRSSWFTWGRSSLTEVVREAPSSDGPASASPTVPAAIAVEMPSADSTTAEEQTSTQAEEQPNPDSALPSHPPSSAAAEARGWLSLRALWGVAAGEGGDVSGQTTEQLAEQRRREAWALKLAAKNAGHGQNLVQGRGQGQRLIDAVPEEEAVTISSTVPAIEATTEEVPTPTTAAPQEMRHKSSSSWSLFSRTPASSSSPIAKSTLSLRAPFLGVASSAASTLSRASSQAGDTTAPSSPQLRPQSDQGPVKPLTGSIRTTSPRQRSTSAFDPSPPPPDEGPIGNLVLPSFNDTFLRPPRSFEPPKSTLTRAVSAVSAYLFHRPPEEGTGAPSLLQQAQAKAGVKTDGMMREMGGTPGMEDPAERLPKVVEAMGEHGEARLGKIKRVVTIGISGWYVGNNLIKSVIGEQTGTAVKFTTMMSDAVQTYLEAHDISSFNIQAIALEGQGTVEERVNKLYNQLVSRDEWVQAITMADAVFVATHSQGCVVSSQLLARMLDQGLIVGTQTHLLAMCGIAQGPFIYLYQSLALAPYFNYLESAPARELFEYQNPESVAAIKFTESLRVILNAGVKVTAIGSLNDQVVPLYSALFSGIEHPAILRAIFIDSDAFLTSDFLANLTVFSARLRNAGLSDHDLIYHISEALAGALTGVGHSKIYEEMGVFNLAVRYHFETTYLTDAPTHLDTQATPPPVSLSFNPRDRRNPYLATWALRGIIEDPQVRQLFSKELVALQEAYETWRPQTKVLKDVKLKLEGIRMLGARTGKL